jgi:hypothetical protein
MPGDISLSGVNTWVYNRSRVFKNSSLVTSRGEFQISRVFPDRTSAKKAQYRFFSIDNGIIIYSRRTGTGWMKYAYIGG